MKRLTKKVSYVLIFFIKLDHGLAKSQKKKKSSSKSFFKTFIQKIFFITETFDLIDLYSNQCFGKEYSHFDAMANPCQLQSREHRLV